LGPVVDTCSSLMSPPWSAICGPPIAWGTRTRQLVRVARLPGRGSIEAMFASLLYLVLRRLFTLVAPNDCADAAAQIEILVLRHQLGILRRQVKRPVYRRCDRALLAAASRVLPRERWGAFLVRPETLLRWHRSLVARKWTRPHHPPGRPAIDPEVRRLILSMARENLRWGYLRIKASSESSGSAFPRRVS